MLPALVIGIFFCIVAALASATFGVASNASVYRLQTQAQNENTIAQEVGNYFSDYGVFPVSLSAMAAKTPYWTMREFTNRTDALAPGGLLSATVPERLVPSSSYAQGLDSDFWNYKRLLTYFPRDSALKDSDFTGVYASTTSNGTTSITGNLCASGVNSTYAVSPKWCGDKLRATYATVTDRTLAMPQETAAYKYQQKTVDKFVSRYNQVYKTNAANAFPVTLTPTVPVALNTLVTVPTGSVIGTSGATCKGTFYWNYATPAKSAIPLECGDLYNYWGKPVSYQKITTSGNKQMALTSNEIFYQQDGTSLKLVTTGVTLTY